MNKVKKDGTPSKQGENGGRPPKYKTEEDLKIRVLEYFAFADERKRMYSKAGLLAILDISRPQYAEYKKKFPNIIRYAEALIEEDWVHRLSETGATGAIFYLKNAFREHYTDSHDLTSDGKALPTPIFANVVKDVSIHDGDKEDKPVK